MDIFSNANDFLFWVRGSAFTIAVSIFIIGVLVRVLEIVLLGKKTDYTEARNSAWQGGLTNIVSRFSVHKDILKRSPLVVIIGYIWHISFFVVLLFFVPHIEVIKATLGLQWPGMATPLIDAFTVVAMVSMLAMLWLRLTHPVLKFLSTFEDYLVWLVTFLPLLTGYIAFHHLVSPYPLALGLHILSVELLLIVFPFTKLMHAFTMVLARWYSGSAMARKGIKS